MLRCPVIQRMFQLGTQFVNDSTFGLYIFTLLCFILFWDDSAFFINDNEDDEFALIVDGVNLDELLSSSSNGASSLSRIGNFCIVNGVNGFTKFTMLSVCCWSLKWYDVWTEVGFFFFGWLWPCCQTYAAR